MNLERLFQESDYDDDLEDDMDDDDMDDDDMDDDDRLDNLDPDDQKNAWDIEILGDE